MGSQLSLLWLKDLSSTFMLLATTWAHSRLSQMLVLLIMLPMMKSSGETAVSVATCTYTLGQEKMIVPLSMQKSMGVLSMIVSIVVIFIVLLLLLLYNIGVVFMCLRSQNM